MSGSLTPIAAALSDAAEAPEAETAAAAAPIAETKPERCRASKAAPRRDDVAAGMFDVPDDMPVEPLGRNGSTFYYLDAMRQLHALPADKHGRAMIYQLFGARADVLFRYWGKRNSKGELTNGFHADTVANSLMHHCSVAGLIDPAKALRGCGAWRDDKGGLVLHLGDMVWIDGQYKPPGRYGAAIFPAMPATIRPHELAQNLDIGAELLDMLRTWHWASGLQPILTLGWLAQGFVVGALDWRTHMIGDGERGTGKSSLFKLVRGLFGNWMLEASDTTPAAVYQLMQARAQPVFFDEFEAGKDPKRKQAVVAVLRQASSGGMVLRGGDDHIGRSFSVQFPAFLTSIVPIALQAQDESRMVRVQLLPLGDRGMDEAYPMPDLAPARMAKLGARLFRRVVDQWPRFARTLDAYRAGLEEHTGFDARMQDTYGTLLACADLVLYDSAEPDAIKRLCADLAVMVTPQRVESSRDQERCLQHLLQSTVDRGVGTRRTVASWLRQAAAFDSDGAIDFERRRDAIQALGVVGIKPMIETDPTKSPPDRSLKPIDKRGLFIVNSHPALKKMFDDSPWPGETGANGAWVTVLRRIDGAEVPGNSQRVGGTVQRGTIVPVGDFMDWGDDA